MTSGGSDRTSLPSAARHRSTANNPQDTGLLQTTRKTPVYCKQHADDGLINVRSIICLPHSCKTPPNFNVDGSKTPVYCKSHAEDGMVNVINPRNSHDSCERQPSINVVGSKKPVCCKHHA
ncbi:unnamed protein product, partial [Laminaria digitata]